MKIGMRNSKDFYAGLVFIFFGLLAVSVARSYPIGTAARMGPGFFPTLLGSILALLGLVLTARALLWGNAESIGGLAFRPLLLVLGAVLAFALLVQPLGLVLATLVLIVTSCLGGRDFCLREVTVLSLILTALVVGVFVYILGLPFNMWPA